MFGFDFWLFSEKKFKLGTQTWTWSDVQMPEKYDSSLKLQEGEVDFSFLFVQTAVQMQELTVG